MGCDIHLITEIKKDEIWQRVDEVSEDFCSRNYNLFSVLADVRNNFFIDGFKPKGLPDDISERHFNFISEKNVIKSHYENDEIETFIMPDGNEYERFDPQFLKIFHTKEEAERHGASTSFGLEEHHVYCPEEFGAVRKIVKYKDTMTFDEYAQKYYKDDWVEEVNDYGRWGIDFDSPDFHSHSWLTLRELLDYDQTDYLAEKVRVPQIFYDKFIELGGVIPEGMTVKKPESSGALESVFLANAFPDIAYYREVIIQFEGQTNRAYAPLQKGIDELREIANQYMVTPNDIRIVFAFDN